MVLSAAAAVCFSGITVWIAVHRQKNKRESYYDPMWICILFASAIFLRFVLAVYSQGYTGDMDAFKIWARTVNEVGFREIYSQDMFLDYPPGYLFILAGLEKLRLLFGLDSGSPFFTLLIKLPSMLGDLFCGAVLLKFARQKLGQPNAMFIAAIYMFCPAVLINSAVWGQADSFCVSVLLISVIFLSRQKFMPAALIYGLAITLKPQMLVFAPLYIFYAIRKKRYLMLLVGPALVLAAILLTALPYTKNFDFRWLIDRYVSTMNYYDYYSVNAYNFWAMIGLNWINVPDGAAGIILNGAGPVLATAVCGFFMLRSAHDDVVFAAPALLMSAVFMFTVKMHERYLFHILIFILLAYIFAGDRRILYSFAAVSALHFLNVSKVLNIYQIFGANYDPNEISVKLLSALQLAALIYMFYVLVRVYLQNQISAEHQGRGFIRSKAVSLPAASAYVVTAKWSSADFIAVALISLIYAVTAFWNLGSHELPQTSWTPAEGDAVVLKADRPADTLCYISGIAPDTDNYNARVGNLVSVELSENGSDWVSADELTADEIDVFKWIFQPLEQSASFIRLTALDNEVCINELGLRRSSDSAVPVKITLVSGSGEALLDESEMIPEYPSSYNSAYFDEIYHARTAYEHISGLEPYENTHPPLGKLLIAAGICIFGMNPFGWRFMGALIGVLMLPVLYHLLKELFGKSFFCIAGTVLFALDFMHFTQTRIATIDSYAVFFIMLMYDAMVVFMKKDIAKTTLKKMMLPLVISGIFMSLGIASKWTVAYGALGLAVLFFIKIFYSLHCCSDSEEIQLMRRKMLKLCLCCCLWFLVIPFAIYFAAFLPMTTLPHNNILSSFINYQKNMFSYHSTLKSTHPFQSPWYEWPFMIRPIWYYYSGEPVSSVAALGNPALWWPAVPAVIASAVLLYFKKELPALIAVTGFISVYLPWVLIPRATFIYHYFTAIPFLIIAVVYILETLSRTKLAADSFHLHVRGKSISVSWYSTAVAAYLLINLMLFTAFYPVLSGAETTREYLQGLQWLSGWAFT